MSVKLTKALEFANYRITLNNQHAALKAKTQSLLSYSTNGGTFTIDRELITFSKTLMDFGHKRSSAVRHLQQSNTGSTRRLL